MRPKQWTTWILFSLWACGGTSNNSQGQRPEAAPGDASAQRSDPPASQPAPTASAPQQPPRPLGTEAQKALAWLIARQHQSGGFGQGEEAANMGNAMASLRDQPNVGDTCAAALALLRSGSTPKDGPYAEPLRKALGFVCSQVEAADRDSLYVTDQKGTRLQAKLGTYVDTFLAAMLFAEIKGRMQDAAAEQRLMAAFDKVMDKIERNQKADGSWANQGWATALTQGIAGKALNRASQMGLRVDVGVLAKVDDFSRQKVAAGTASAPSADSAGVALYAASSTLSVLAESEATLKAREQALRLAAADPKRPAAQQAAQQELDRLEQTAQARASAQQEVVRQLDDPRFLAGFGSNGGEEFLSYMNLSESLRARGGEEWTRWNDKITANLQRIQNQDGSWSGHHCITGRTFCTSAALLVLMADRAPLPGTETLAAAGK